MDAGNTSVFTESFDVPIVGTSDSCVCKMNESNIFSTAARFALLEKGHSVLNVKGMKERLSNIPNRETPALS